MASNTLSKQLKNFKQLKNKIESSIFGQEHKDSFRDTFFLGFCIVFSGFSSIGIIFNYSVGLDSSINTICLIVSILYGLFYYIFRFKKTNYYRKIPFIAFITTIIFFVFAWFSNGGLIGTIPAIFIIIVFCFLVILDKKHWNFTSITLVFTFIFVLILEQKFPEWITMYPSSQAHKNDLAIGYTVSLLMLIYLVRRMLSLQYKEKETVQKKNQALLASERKLKKAIVAANDASLAKANFLSVMSHELRTPMNAVIGMTHLLMQENPNTTQVDRLRILQFSADQLMVLINDILDFNKIDAGKIEFEETNFNLKKLLDNIHQTLISLAEDKGLHFKIMVDDEIANKLVGDPNRLAQVINNLVSNAIKFTQEGEIIIKATLDKYTPEESRIHFQIIDTGIGIPESKIDRIFDNFTQASSSTTRQFGGTGLGLTITKKLLALQNSTIKVESELGEGSTFSFILAFKNSNFVEQAPSRAETTTTMNEGVKKDNIDAPIQLLQLKQVEPPSLSERHVLVVEDHKVNQIVIGNFLKKWKVSFDLAENGEEAVKMAESNIYDLILMDLQLPLMDGYEATILIRKNENIKQIPIIAVTASAIVEINKRALAVGMDDFVTKPFKPEELNKVLLKFIGRRKEI